MSALQKIITHTNRDLSSFQLSNSGEVFLKRTLLDEIKALFQKKASENEKFKECILEEIKKLETGEKTAQNENFSDLYNRILKISPGFFKDLFEERPYLSSSYPNYQFDKVETKTIADPKNAHYQITKGLLNHTSSYYYSVKESKRSIFWKRLAIGLLTQLQRLLSLIGRIVEFIASLFSIKITWFYYFHYRNCPLPPQEPLMRKKCLLEKKEDIFPNPDASIALQEEPSAAAIALQEEQSSENPIAAIALEEENSSSSPSHETGIVLEEIKEMPAAIALQEVLEGAQIVLEEIKEREIFETYFLGHSSFVFQLPSELNLITNPIDGALNKLFYPRMIDPALKVNQLMPMDMVLLTDTNPDHFDEKTLRKLVLQQPLIIAPKGAEKRLKDLGFTHICSATAWEEKKVHFSDKGQESFFSFTAVPANKISGRGLVDQAEEEPLAYVLHIEGKNIYFDTGAAISDEDLENLQNHFSIQASFQGATQSGIGSLHHEQRTLFESVYAHLKMAIEPLVRNQSKEKFLSLAEERTLSFVDIKAFKIGLAKFDDAENALQALLTAIDNDTIKLSTHDQKMLDKIKTLITSWRFSDGELSREELKTLIQQFCIIPSIGRFQKVFQ